MLGKKENIDNGRMKKNETGKGVVEKCWWYCWKEQENNAAIIVATWLCCLKGRRQETGDYAVSQNCKASKDFSIILSTPFNQFQRFHKNLAKALLWTCNGIL